MIAPLVLAAVLAQQPAPASAPAPPPDDAARLVEKLGASRFADRESASTALRKLGREALAPLRAATRADDAEVRARALALVAEIEARLMVEPTMVRLAFRDRPLGEVVAAIGEQADLTLALPNEPGTPWATRKVTIEASEPVPLWEALERIGRTAGLQLSPNLVQFQGLAQGRSQVRTTLQFIPAEGGPAPAGTSGAFRLSALSILHHKDRTFGGIAGPVGFAPGMAVPGRRRAAPAGAEVAAGAAVETFAVTLQLNAEPRLNLVQNGAYKLLEAVDERGRSLLPAAESGGAVQAFAGFQAMGSSALQMQVPLSLPDEPGRMIKRLRVAVPVMLLSRKDEPFVIALDEAKGKLFEAPSMSIRVHDVRAEANQPFTLIELTAKMRREEAAEAVPGQLGPEFSAFRLNGVQAQGQVEIADAQGRLYNQWFPFNPQSGPEGLRMGLRLVNNEGLGPPTQMRIYDLGRAETQVVVELTDIPMP